MIRECGHTQCNVADLDRTISFYRDVVGLKLARVHGGRFTQVAPTKTQPAPAAFSKIGSQEIGLGHLGFLVDDMDAAYRELSKKGVKFLSEPFPGNGAKHVCFNDPDGITIELTDRTGLTGTRVQELLANK